MIQLLGLFAFIILTTAFPKTTGLILAGAFGLCLLAVFAMKTFGAVCN